MDQSTPFEKYTMKQQAQKQKMVTISSHSQLHFQSSKHSNQFTKIFICYHPSKSKDLRMAENSRLSQIRELKIGRSSHWRLHPHAFAQFSAVFSIGKTVLFFGEGDDRGPYKG
ncbi:hypothetical protein CEXT_191041 [Caerostris extrusa]|uniref:Uncharacterized protein n=1 Tax=Caerostris extrusa TaxID=172846 RepID=A0AAV4WC74_CAEEX|nr:hypothetical protein CEXT_191041 [Caerostris extrusa]